MLDAMQASSDCAPAFCASSSTSTCTRGEIVAQLMKSLPRALTSRLSPAPAKISRIAASSVTTVKIDVRGRRYFRQILAGGAAKFLGQRGRGLAILIVHGGDVEFPVLQSTRHVCAHSSDSDKTDVHTSLTVCCNSADLQRTLIRAGPEQSHFPGEERIVRFFLANACHRTVPRTNDGFVRQSQNFFQIVPNGIFVGNVAAAHRAGKKRIADNRDGLRQAGHDIGHSAGRMSPGRSRLDLEFANIEMLAFLRSVPRPARIRAPA